MVESRGRSAWGFLAKTTDPERALRNLLERDRAFTDILRDETARLELPAVEVDAATTDHFVFEGFTTETVVNSSRAVHGSVSGQLTAWQLHFYHRP
ncbi:MAG: hypothetical protein ACJ74Q_26310 [Pyrinomonadaceae bacterium]